MVTVKRNESGRSNTLVLERTEVANNTNTLSDELLAERVIDELLAVEKYDAVEDVAFVNEKISTLDREIEGFSFREEDLQTPSSTTMQFKGKESAEDFYNDSIAESSFSYKLNKKGKMLIAIYSIAVAFILALIVLNTGVINSIQARLNEKAQEVAQLQAEYAQITEELDLVSSDEYVIDKAINEYNMSK